MVEKADARVAHPDAVVVHTHHALPAPKAAVGAAGRHNLSALLAEAKLADVRQLLVCLCFRKIAHFNVT